MKNYYSLLICLMCFAGGAAIAQPNSDTAVFGVVVEKSTGEPMEFVDVVLYEHESETFLDGITTNKKGEFRFSDIAPGKYYVQTNFMGYEPMKSRVFSIDGKNQAVDLKKIPIEITVSLLDQVEVTATKSTLNLGLDRRAYNVDADIMSQTSSATEILQNLPSVTVDVNGQVSLRGTSNITYLINGRPSALLRAGGAAALQQIPANSIERIEVITNPSAKYRPDGIGGIINIVLKDANKQGLNGSVLANVGNLDRYNANILLNYGKDDVNFFGSYGIRHANTPQDITDLRIDREEGVDINSFKNVSDVTFGELSHLATAGVSFPLGESGSVEISGEYFYLNNDNNSFTRWDVTEDDALSQFNIDRQYNGYEQEYDVGVAYEREFENEDHSLAIEFNLSGYEETEDNLYDEQYLTPFTGNALSRNLIKKGGPVMEFVVEYARPIGRESELELGYLGEIMKDDIDILGEDFENSWMTDPLKTYRFKFNQTVHAGYGVFTQTIESFYYSVGLRAEQTTITSNLVSSGEKIPNDYFNIFPTLALGLELGDNEEIRLSYSKRINRADPDEQNPFPEYDDPRTRDRGNPKLLPEQVHSVELGYRLQNEKFTFMPTLYYRYLYDGFTEFREIVEDTVLQTTFTNFSNQTLAGAELIFKGNVAKFLDLNFSANAYYNELDGTNLGLDANQSQITWDTKLGANFNISKNTYGQINAQYISSRLTPQGEFQPIVLLNLGLRQDIFNRNASILFTVSDVFASVEFESLIDNPNLYWNTIYGRNNQIFYLGFSYRFGQSYVNKRKRKPEKLDFEDAIEVPNPVPKEDEEE
ncbi:MAG: TonB-dependent receptor [Lewinellaceae bacterium]|nr:TonB-dependent receptor [Phaeodactylibacter sp.]MCB9039961.1 TonB-dependent receptor [Lewinellaceae bacterium]